MWQKCGHCHNCHNYPREKNVEKKFKNPHRIDFYHIRNISKKEMWRLEPLVYIANNPFTTFPHPFKTFWRKYSLKIFYLYICNFRLKIDYYSHIPTKIASTFLKTEMFLMWTSAITNTFLTLKMWTNLCSKNYVRKCNIADNKYDDRGRILG